MNNCEHKFTVVVGWYEPHLHKSDYKDMDRLSDQWVMKERRATQLACEKCGEVKVIDPNPSP